MEECFPLLVTRFLSAAGILAVVLALIVAIAVEGELVAAAEAAGVPEMGALWHSLVMCSLQQCFLLLARSEVDLY